MAPRCEGQCGAGHTPCVVDIGTKYDAIDVQKAADLAVTWQVVVTD